MYNFTQAELQQMQDYINLAKAHNQFKDFKERIRELQKEVQYKHTTAGPKQSQQWQETLADTLDAQQRFTEHCFDKEKGIFRTGTFKAPEDRTDLELTSPSHLDSRMQKMEPAITRAFQHTQEPPDLLNRAYTQVQAEQQRRQETQNRYSSIRAPHTQASHQTDEQTRTKMPQDYGEIAKHNEQQPTQGLSQDEQNRQNVASQEDARYGISEAQKLNEQKLENLPYEARFLTREKTPGRSGPKRSGPEHDGPGM